MRDGSTGGHIEESSTNVFTNIFIMFTNLIYLHLNLQDTCRRLPKPVINLLSTPCYASNIVHLNVSVFDFDNCLCLLDGRLSQLHTFIVKVDRIFDGSMIIKNTVKYFKS
jgi:hypothetical protein